MGIGWAALRSNIDFVLDNLSIRLYFKAVISAEDVLRSKPDPETYLALAALLNKAPADCIVFEDAPMGVESALRADMDCIAVLTTHAPEEFKDNPHIIAYIHDYQDPFLLPFFG